MSFGKDSGSSSKSENMLTGIINQLSAETDPLRVTLANQFQEALQTGGVNARIPIIDAAQSQSRQATSRALTGTTSDLVKMGLARTPFAASTLAGTRLAGEAEAEMIPSRVASGFIANAPQYSMAPVGGMISGLSSMASTQSSRDVAKGNQTTQLFVGMMNAAAQASKGGA